MKTDDKGNPLAVLDRVWRIGERVVLFSALMVVGGTLGYVSVHILA
jgi:ribosomal protein S5